MNYEGVNRRKNLRRVVALPVRLRIAGVDAKSGAFSACTLDIAPGGARISHPGIPLEVGQVVTLERSKERSMFRVVWVGDESSRKGQVGLQCVEPECNLWKDMGAKRSDEDKKDDDLLRAILKR